MNHFITRTCERLLIRLLSQYPVITLTGPDDKPGVGWFAQIEDPERNRLGLMQPDEGAK